MQEEVPFDEIDRFHEERDKIYLDEYKASRQKKHVAKEFMPLSSGKIWSASDTDDEDYENEDAGLSATHRALLKQEKLNQFKKSMGSDFEDSDVSDEEEAKDEVDDQVSVSKESDKPEKKKKDDDGIGVWGGKKKTYYGGDEGPEQMDSDEEEMTLEECRRLRSQLADSAHLNHPMVMAARSDLFDLVYAAGGSRFHLNPMTSESRSTNSLSDEVSPKPILTREDESEAYMRHSMPVFFCPEPAVENNVDKMKEYLKKNYPDLAGHYQEYVKVKNWLETVWEPLFKNYIESGRIRGDSIAGQYIVQRKGRMEVEREGLALYYRMRQEQKSMFRYHPIHKALVDLLEERKSCSKQDRAFLLLAGNVLLKNIDTGKSFADMASGIPGSREFLRCLCSPEEEKRLERLAKVSPKTNYESTGPSKKSNQDVKNSDDDIMMTSDSENEERRRPITYQMAKNKGFMVHRPKRDRNPRVKLRHKYKKALIRRRSQVPNIRTEDKPYGGEVFGIRAGLVKSRKIK